MNNLIEIKNIIKKYGDTKKNTILNKINYSFKRGKIYSLVGPSGSGKSTLLNLISLIDRPSSGFIKFEGKKIDFNLNIKNDQFRAKNIGIIYQQDNLLTDFNALENVYLANLSAGKNKDIAMENAEKILKTVGLSNRFEHYPTELSGGEKQRVSIARAVMNDPEIILADEPTGSLDRKTANEIFLLFSKLKSKNRAILYATHNRELSNKADYKLNILDGNIFKNERS